MEYDERVYDFSPFTAWMGWADFLLKKNISANCIKIHCFFSFFCDTITENKFVRIILNDLLNI